MSIDNLKTILNAIKCLLTDYPKKKDIPTKLPNPNALNFTGAVTGSYDGSEALTVEIPSVPKPLTYDYMPEGYPKKSVQATTLMAEQAVEFASMDPPEQYGALLTEALDIIEGQTYTVKWDGTEYECVCYTFSSMLVLGNLSIMGVGDDTGEPFVYANTPDMGGGFNTLDTSASHTISVKRTEKTVTPMAEEFIPATALITYNSSTDTYSSDLTYNELHERLLGGKQIVLHKTVENEYFYLTKWMKVVSGRIDLAFAGDAYSVSLNTDGTIGKKPLE